MKQLFSSAGPAARKGLLAAVLACTFGATAIQAGAQTVKPPPRPPGSSMVVIQAGLNPDEAARQKRAHKDKIGKKKNLVLDEVDAPAHGHDHGKDKSKDNNGKGSKK